jgi:hypothetical protein
MDPSLFHLDASNASSTSPPAHIWLVAFISSQWHSSAATVLLPTLLPALLLCMSPLPSCSNGVLGAWRVQPAATVLARDAIAAGQWWQCPLRQTS